MGASHPSHEASPPGSTNLIGRVLGSAYRIVRELDSGGMGQVYEAEHVRLNRRLAVKIMAGHLAHDANAMARFHREAEIISQLSHPHIVQVVDFDTTPEGQPFLVMEYLRGVSLEARLQIERGGLPVVEALKITSQAAAGLHAAHAAGIVHRDLKPANVFLVDGGSGSIWPDRVFVKLLDFGISKRTGHGHGLTGEFDILGTPDYMAPEQALGKTAAVDPRGDQFALAVITYEMLTGALPFAADEVMDVLKRVIRDTPSAPSALRPDLPLELDEVLLRALAKHPEERFPTIGEFAEQLNAVAGDSGRQSISSIHPPSPRAPSRSESALTLAIPPQGTQPEQATLPARTESPSRPPVASFLSASHEDPAALVRDLVERTRQELGLDNPDMALRYAESVLSIADELPDDSEVLSVTRSAHTLFRRVFERYIGHLDVSLIACTPPSGQSELSPQQAFLLSRMDGPFSIEEAIDLAPWPQLQTLRLLAELMRAGHLRVDRSATGKTTTRRREP